MKIKFLKFKNWILALLAGTMGLQQGCHKMMVAEYGCPEAEYHIKGTVINEEGNPIPGIGVNRTRDWENRDGEWVFEDTTNSGGHFFIKGIQPEGDNIARVALSDIDSNANGSYQDTIVDVSFEGVPFIGGDGRWNQGTATKEVTITMRRNEKYMGGNPVHSTTFNHTYTVSDGRLATVDDNYTFHWGLRKK